MFRIKIILSLILFCACFQSILGQNWNGKKLKFKETAFSFGIFRQSDMIKHEFKFKNISKQRIVIVKASASCGCTVVDYSSEPLFAGEWGHITVTYSGKGKEPGYFNKGINILTNKEIIRLEISGTML